MSEQKHIMRFNLWEQGRLSYIEKVFDTLSDALLHASTHGHSNVESIKIYSPDGQVVHSVVPSGTNSGVYA